MKRAKSPVAQVEREPTGFRKFYNRCRRYCIAAWCWLTSRRIDPPPPSSPEPERPIIIPPEERHVSKQMPKDADPEIKPLLEKEPLQKSSPIPALPRIGIRESIDVLFLGLDSSGISTTANNLFNNNDTAEISTEHLKTKELEIIETNQTLIPSLINLRVIDVPGFCKGRAVDEDAEMILALNSYLKSSLPNKVPNVTFIISRFDDNRFSGEGSDFSKMLLALSHSQMHWTDPSHSNVELLLTHGDKVKEGNFAERIAEFQKVFHTIFPKPHSSQSVSCTVIDNNNEAQMSEIRKAIFTHVLFTRSSPRVKSTPEFKGYIEQLKNSAALTPNKNCKLQKTPISALLPPNRRDVNQLLDTLLQGIPYQRNNCDGKPSSTFFSYFPSFKSCHGSGVHPQGFEHHVSKLLPEMELLMGDGVTKLHVSQIMVGHKLFSIDNLGHSVVTGITSTVCDRRIACSQVGIHFYKRPDDYDEDEPMVYKYTGKTKLKPEKFDWDTEFLAKYNNQRREDELILYELEINDEASYEDTFIVDNGYVILASVEPNESTI